MMEAEMTLSEASILSQLFGESASRFMDEFWPHTFFHYRGPIERLTLLCSNPDLQSVEALLDWAMATKYNKFEADLPAVRDEFEHVSSLDDRLARAALKSGMTLRLSLREEFPEVNTFVEELKQGLELPAYSFTRNITYCSPPGEGTSLHFDQNINIVVQMSGKKTWFIAPNEFAANPTVRYSTRQSGIPTKLADYVEMLPKEHSQIRNGVTIDMIPGDVLFVPAGWWHSTTCTEESLQVNFTSDSPNWCGMLLNALARHLQRRAEWRGLATGLNSQNVARKRRARDRLDALVRQVADIVGSLDMDSISTDAEWWAAAERLADKRTYKKPQGVSFSWEESALNVTSEDGAHIRLDLEAEYLPLAKYICEAALPFTEDDVAHLSPTLDRPNLRRFLAVLTRHKVLEATLD
jgi:50S ribosomal protein L16 3-hydroxylase